MTRDEQRIHDTLVRVGAEKRAAARARGPAVPGHLAEPMWTIEYLHAEVNRAGRRIGKARLRMVLDAMAQPSRRLLVKRNGSGRPHTWGLKSGWDQ